MEYRLCPSILSADFNRLGEQIKILENQADLSIFNDFSGIRCLKACGTAKQSRFAGA